MSNGTVAVHCGTWGEYLLDALRRGLPDARLVAVGTPEAGTADVLVTLVDDGPALAAALTPGVRWVDRKSTRLNSSHRH